MRVFGVRVWATMLDSYVGLMQLVSTLRGMVAVEERGEGEKGTVG